MLAGWGPILSVLELIPASKGRFEVTVDDELIFSKATLGRHARAGEIAGIVRARIGGEVRPGH